MDDMKKCFKCKKIKSLDKFYKHKGMDDGHLGKCKSCTKIDVYKRYNDPRFYLRIKEYEKQRFKDPQRKKKLIEYQRKRRLRNSGKYKARTLVGNKIRSGQLIRNPCEICGKKKTEAHHLDYRKPLLIRWLCFKHHREIHL